MSITTVLIVPVARLNEGGTIDLRLGLRVSKKTSQPTIRFLCFIYVASWAGPGTSKPFNIFNSTT